MGNHLLLTILGLPVLGTFILILIKEENSFVLKTIAAIVTGLQLWLVIQLLSNFDKSAGYLQFVEHFSWINLLNIDFIIGLNGINLLFLALSTVIFFAIVFISWQLENRQKSFFVLMMLLNTGITGLFIAYDLFLFLMFYGIALFSMFLLITLFTSKSENINNGYFGMYALISFCLVTIGILVINNHSSLYGFNLNTLARNPGVLTDIQTRGFFIFLIGFLLITPVVPFHTWLVPAAGNSIASVSILLLALFSKISIFGILHILIPLFPHSSMQFALIFGILGLISILYFAFCVFSFPQYRKIVIYFTGFLNGFIYLGLSALLSIRQQNQDAALAGLNGAVIQAISAGLLILIMMLLPKIRHTAMEKSLISNTNHWVVMFMMLMILLAGIGLPGFLDFIGQFLCLSG
ncbi:MAG: hypothetical protein JXR87_04035, partial [Candidatus Marinimicrobia bacterium]|nr:hypothetical protein [Candidatus Neomarinimicrobiota bacterium]